MPLSDIALSYLCNILDLAWKFTLHCPIYVLSMHANWRHDKSEVRRRRTRRNPRRNLTSNLLKMGIKKRPFLGQFGHSNPLKSSTLSAEAIGTIKNYKMLLETCGILS